MCFINEVVQFTMEYSNKKIFRYVNKKGDSGISMDMYRKPTTDTQIGFPCVISHPKQCLKNISFVMARQICAIAENNSIKSNI